MLYCPLFSGSVLPLGKMELNPVAGLVLLSRATAVCDDKPSLADLDSEEDDDDEHGNFLSTTEINCLIPIIFCTVLLHEEVINFPSLKIAFLIDQFLSIIN